MFQSIFDSEVKPSTSACVTVGVLMWYKALAVNQVNITISTAISVLLIPSLDEIYIAHFFKNYTFKVHVGLLHAFPRHYFYYVMFVIHLYYMGPKLTNIILL